MKMVEIQSDKLYLRIDNYRMRTYYLCGGYYHCQAGERYEYCRFSQEKAQK